MGTVRTQTIEPKWSQKSARVGARERSTRTLQTTCASSSTIRPRSLAARPRCRWAWTPPISSAHRHGPEMLRARAYARYGATRRCAPIVSTLSLRTQYSTIRFTFLLSIQLVHPLLRVLPARHHAPRPLLCGDRHPFRGCGRLRDARITGASATARPVDAGSDLRAGGSQESAVH